MRIPWGMVVAQGHLVMILHFPLRFCRDLGAKLMGRSQLFVNPSGNPHYRPALAIQPVENQGEKPTTPLPWGYRAVCGGRLCTFFSVPLGAEGLSARGLILFTGALMKRAVRVRSL